MRNKSIIRAVEKVLIDAGLDERSAHYAARRTFKNTMRQLNQWGENQIRWAYKGYMYEHSRYKQNWRSVSMYEREFSTIPIYYVATRKAILAGRSAYRKQNHMDELEF